MNPVLFQTRGGRPDDSNELLDIDIKCFEKAWSAEEWARIGYGMEHAISVVTVFGTPIGFSVSRARGTGIEIVKLAVKPAHRLKTVSLYLLAAVVGYAMNRQADHVFIIIPESTVYPGPQNVSKWLTAVGFKPTKPFLKNHFTAYGESEDGVKFTAPVRR